MAARNPLEQAVHGHRVSPEDAAGPSSSASGSPAPAIAPAAEADRIGPAQALLGHRFARPALLREALTHRSALARPGRGGRRRGRRGPAQDEDGPVLSNERLEFVGDRVLGLLVAEWLIERFPQEQEGELGRRLAQLVSQPVLAEVAEAVGLPAALDVAPGEARAGVARRATVLADAVEAAIGALFLDGGIEAARRFVRRALDGPMTAQADPPKDSKTALQEWAQKRGLPLPDYELVGREGPPHAPRFVVRVAVAGQDGEGSSGTRRGAEQAAAEAVMRKLDAPA